jgi:hypothetical protein
MRDETGSGGDYVFIHKDEAFTNTFKKEAGLQVCTNITIAAPQLPGWDVLLGIYITSDDPELAKDSISRILTACGGAIHRSHCYEMHQTSHFYTKHLGSWLGFPLSFRQGIRLSGVSLSEELLSDVRA